MRFEQEQVMGAFRIFSLLAARGKIRREEARLYFFDDMVCGLVHQMADETGATVVVAGDYLYLVPIAASSDFHVSNESLRSRLGSRASNADVYLMYVAIIVLFGEFYDSYQTTEPTRDFIQVGDWLESLSQRLAALKEIGRDELENRCAEQEYNWLAILEKWEALDDIKETARVQDGRTASRLSFLNSVRRFLEEEELVVDIGEDQVALTEKAKIIVQRYYMDVEHNQDILNFMYQMEQVQEE